MPSKPLNATAASLLGLLHDGPLTGWDLVSKAEEEIGAFWSLTRSQVYRELKAMADAGLVAPEQSGPRERQPYRLTDVGKDAFQQWLRTEPGPEQIRYPLLLRMLFGRHLEPEILAGFIAEHRSQHIATLDGYREEADAAARADAYTRAVIDLGIRYEQAVIDWIDNLPSELRGTQDTGD